MANITEKASDLKARAAALVAQQQMLEAQVASGEAEMRELSSRILMAPRVQAILEATQARAHSRAVGAYEAILTGLIHDVLGERAGQARLTASQRAGHPALDIDIVKPEGIEDIMDGNGGALTNIVCAGLRFAAIARSGLRKFIVLDEPDCWLKPELVPVFFRSIAAVCDQAGFQAVVISHHNVARGELPSSTSFVELSAADDGTPRVSCELSGPAGENALSYLWLRQFRAHQDTFVEFGPGLTLLSGPNNLGKSAIVAALRAIAHGGASDSQIMHGADELFCELGFMRNGEPERVALTRKRNGSPRVVLQHLDAADRELHAERGTPSAAPEWVTSLLGITEIEDIDPQLLHQKTPIFLLNQPASTRAKLLYAGREAAHLARMFEEQNRQLREDRRNLERVRVQLTVLADKLGLLHLASDTLARAEATVAAARGIEAAAARTGSVDRILPRMDSAAAKARVPVSSAQLPSLPDLHDTKQLRGLAAMLNAAQVTARISLPQAPEPPAMKPSQAVLSAGRKMRRLAQVSEAGRAMPDLLAPPVLRDTRALVSVSRGLARWRRLIEVLESLPGAPALPATRNSRDLQVHLSKQQEAALRVAKLEVEMAEVRKTLEAVDQELSRLVELSGNTCPICHQHLTKEHLHAY